MRNNLPRLSILFSILFLLILSNIKVEGQTYPVPGLTLPNGKTIVITYEVDVKPDACPTGTVPLLNISNQSTVSGGNFASKLTDDPDFGGATDPTLTPFGALTLGNLVYKDNNKNGVFDAGDAGINGVLLRLYLDNNSDGVLTVADGAALATTTTAGGGLYTFTECPGNYIVEVAASNFTPGQPLYDNGLMLPLLSSPVGGSADPDNDVNNDDNGDAVAGFGVASQAITLGYGAEPTTDGDALNNTNLSLDFGFKIPTTVTISDVTMNEGSGGGTTNFNFTVTRSDNVEAFSLTVNTMDGTAVSPADFAAISGGTVSFTAGGSTTAMVTVTVVADNIVEPVEAFTVVLSGPPASVVISDASGQGLISNDDSAVVTLTGGVSQNEGTSFVFSATLNNAVQGGFTVAYSTNNGTATVADMDYTDNDGPALVFAGTAGEIQTFTVITTNDTKVEAPTETFTVGLGTVTSGVGANITTTGTPQTGTILDNDQAIVSIVPVSMNEGNAGPTNFTFTVTLSNAVDIAIGVGYTTSDGTAVDAFSVTGTDDYNASSGTLNFTGTAGETKTFNVVVNGDNVVESTETFNAILNNIIAPMRNVIFTGGTPTLSVTGTILNDDSATVTLSGGTSVNEGNSGLTPMVFTMTLNGPVQGGLVVNYKSFDGTATTADNDYVAVDNSAIFSGNTGETKMFTVNINGDLNIENAEMFTTAITDITGSPTIQANVTAVNSPQTGTITNDELDWGDAPTAAQSGFANPYPTTLAQNGARHGEAPGGLHLGATVDADLDGQPTGAASGDGADEDGVTLPASIITGLSANITVNSSGTGALDAWVDFNRDGDWGDVGEKIFTNQGVVTGPNALSFVVPAGASVGTSYARFRLSTAGGLSATGLAADGEVEDYSISIITNQFSIDNPSVLEGNAGTTTLTFTVTRATNTTNDAVDYAVTGGTATSGTDYVPVIAGTLMFPMGGALTQMINVTVNGDLIVENHETIIITLSNPVNGGLGTNPGTGTITNDDAATLTLSGGVSQNEGTSFVFTATLNNVVQGGFSAPYTTDNGTATTANNDYTDNDGALVFAGTAGESHTITVQSTADNIVELDETFTVALGAVAGQPGITIAGSPQTGTITNDDQAIVSIVPVSMNEGNAGPTIFTFTATLSQAVDVSVSAMYITSDGTAIDFGAGNGSNDYNSNSGTLTFTGTANETKTFTVQVNGDVVVELDEMFNVVLSALSASGRNVIFTGGNPTLATTGTIVNDDQLVLSFANNPYSVNEGNSGTTSHPIAINRSNPIDIDPIINVTPTDGTATLADNDFLPGPIGFNISHDAGVATSFIPSIVGDTKMEPTENFNITVTASNFQGRNIIFIGGGPSISTTVNITNDDTDYGDAPDTYATLLVSNGARHGGSNLRLGVLNDGDTDGQPTGTANGDDTDTDGDDEDGVTIPTLVTATTVMVTVNASAASKLDAWVDFTGNGSFADAGEKIFNNAALVSGINNLSFSVPAGAVVGSSFARFRQSSAGGLSFSGLAADGEVEDYQVNIVTNQFSIDNPMVIEGNAGTVNLVYTVTRTTNTTASSVDYAITGGTATIANNDYQPLAAGTINFLAMGALTQTITVVVNGDMVVEGNETIIMMLSNPVNGGIGANPGTGTITNDDAASLVLSGGIAQSEGNAGTTAYVFTATLNPTVQGGFTVAYTSDDGTATTADNDYQNNDGSLVFAGTAGETKTFTVLVNGDNKVELNETFTAALGAITNTTAPAGSITIGGSPQTGTITNDDAAVVSITADVSQAENLSPQVFTVTLSNPVDVAVTVLFNTSDGTATIADNDYAAVSGQTVMFGANTTTSQTVNVTIINDNKVENNEVYNVAIGTLNASGRNVSLGSTTRTGTITNEDAATVTLTPAGGITQNEGNTGTTLYQFFATLNNPVQGSFIVNYTSDDGTANAGTDYINNDGIVSFNGTAGQSQPISILVLGDLIIEPDETFTVALGAITGAPAGVTTAGSPQTGTILNDELDWGDAPTAAQTGFASSYPTLSADGGASHVLTPGGLHLGATVDADLDGQPNLTSTGDGADEDGVTLPSALVINTTANIVVNASDPGFLNAFVDFNRDGDWFDSGEAIFFFFPVVAGNNNLSFPVPAGATLGTSYARFRIFTQAEIGVGGNAPNGEVEDYQVNIVNTQFSVNDPSVVEGNAGTANLVFTITRSNNSNNCSIDYAITNGTATTADNDYQPLASGTATFTAGGALTQTVTVLVNGDLKVELDETVNITLSNPVNSSILDGAGVGTITNDDAALITITNQTVTEGDAGTQPMTFTVSMSAIVDVAVTFSEVTSNGTAAAPLDFVAIATTPVSIPSGSTSVMLTVTINSDCNIEANEVFQLVLSALNASGRNVTFSPAGSTLSGTGTILNDDFVPAITFCPANVTINCQDVTLPSNTGTATATDDCPGVMVTSSDITVGGNCINNYVINRTWKATDNTNDMATCTQIITVRDITPPTISCPGNMTVSCANEVPTQNVQTGFMTSDNCGGGVTISYLGDVISNLTCTNRYLITRSYRATDACGNSASCQQLITVNDQTPPTLTCPPPATFQCASDVPAANTALVSSTDNCGGVASVSHVGDAITNQTCPNKFTLTRTYRATDVCGNSATCTQTFTVNDNTNPTLTCPGTITVQCASLVPVPNTALVTGTDNCSGTPSITFVSDVISNLTCTNKFTVTRTYRATDLCGNSATCSQTIIVNDNTVPTLTCPINVTVQCASAVPAVNTAGVVTADNCGPVPTVTHVGDVISNMTCTNRFIVTRTYRTTDACGNSATCAQTITVFDNTAPTLTCPANLTVQCAALVPANNVASVITADNCGTPTVTFVSDVITNMTCANRFIVNRTYRSTDVCGNSATCIQLITVNDNTAPVITFTESHIAGLATGGRFDVQCFGQDPMWDLPQLGTNSVSVSDNCVGAVTVVFSQILQDEGNCPVDGYITLYKLTWTATDVCGNTSSRHVFMALVDHIAPILFNVPDDITVNCDEVPAIPTDIYATDECISASNITYSGPPPGPGCQNGQVITRSWTATDLCGNKTTETQHITLIAVKPPVIQVLQPELAFVTDNITLKYTCNEGGIPKFFDELNAESVFAEPSCGSPVTVKFEKSDIHSVNCKRAGYLDQQTYHWLAVDVCGNVSNLTIIAQLVDSEAPVIDGVPELTCIDDPALKHIEAKDNCGDAFLSYWDVKIPNPCGTGLAIRRTYEAYDHCGNSSRDTSILIPNDHVGPIMTFTNPLLINLPPGEVLLIDCDGHAGDYTPFSADDVTVGDGCSSEVTVTFREKVLESNGCENGVVATLSLEWSATDICGNVTTKTVQAFVVDHTRPVIVNFRPEVTIGCNGTLPAINATDNCGDVSIVIEESTLAGTCEFEYDVTRTITATDPCGNVTTVTQIVHVGDGSGPVISGVVEEICDDLSIPDVTAYDPCSDSKVNVTMTEEQLDSQCRDGKIYQRTWTATDACGNVSTETQVIIVGDKTPPEIQVPTWSIILKYLDAAPGSNYVNLSNESVIDRLNDLDDGSVYVTDECDVQVIPVFTLDVTYAGNCEEDGYYEHRVYSWKATDICGNETVLTFDVYIVDDVAPALQGVPADATYICLPLPGPAFVSSDDPAQPVSIVYDQVMIPGGPGEFSVIRTWTGTDACGNVTTASQQIKWIPDTQLECDIVVPQVQCNTHGVVISSIITGGLGAVTYEWEVVGPGFIQSGQGTDEITIYVGWTTIVVNLTVRDAFGCESECSAIIDCIDSAVNPLDDNSPSVTPETVVDHAADITTDQVMNGNLSDLSLWPNPANGNVNISFVSRANQEVKFRLTNFLGQDQLAEKINATEGRNTQLIDVSRIPEGSYLMEVKTDSGVYTKVVVIMRK